MRPEQRTPEQLARVLFDRLALTWNEAGALVFGPDVARETGPQVQRLHERGAHFWWTAAALEGASFWDLHVGAVVDPATSFVRLGLHRATAYRLGERLFERLEPDCAARGLVLCEAPAAEEVQLCSAPFALGDESACERAANEFLALVRWTQPELRRFLA